MKKGILIIGLILAGLGLVQVKSAMAEDLLTHLNRIREAKAQVIRRFAQQRPPRAYASEDDSDTSDEESESIRTICAANPEASLCRQALPQMNECQLQCVEDYSDSQKNISVHDQEDGTLAALEDYSDSQKNLLIQQRFNTCMMWCSYSNFRDENFRTSEHLMTTR
jgi:hypothetical protein